ncbi:MAG TPA: DUF5668 domain-containing protein [Candidatus Angelobacter sp.]|nr:DUF5668 domain-containing protein [Candidatus Angelobacter sp.]
MSNNAYTSGRRCGCRRCIARGLIGPAVLVTLGVLFLLQEYYIIPFEQSWPVLLLVIGVMIFLSRTAPTEGHISGAIYGTYIAPAPPAAQSSAAPPTPPAPPQSDDHEVKL